MSRFTLTAAPQTKGNGLMNEWVLARNSQHSRANEVFVSCWSARRIAKKLSELHAH
jgi:hypothetical protein